MDRIEYNFCVVDSFPDTSKSTRPPGQSDPQIGSAPGASESWAWRKSFGPTVRKVMSLRHVSLREMGWSRNPTSPVQHRDQRVRRPTEHSANTPSLLHRKRVLSADAHSEWLGVCLAPQVYGTTPNPTTHHHPPHNPPPNPPTHPQDRRAIA